MAMFDEWLKVTDPSVIVEALASQFRITEKELHKANEALAPAFAIGMQRAMADPQAWAGLSKAFTAMVPPGLGAGQQSRAGPAFLDAFFRSDGLVSAVARQASTFAGIAPDTMQKLMPGLAMMTMDQMVRTALQTMARTQPAGLATGDFGAATAEMMRRGAHAVEALSHPSDSNAAPALPSIATPAAVKEAMARAFTDAMSIGFGWIRSPDANAATPAEPTVAARPAASMPQTSMPQTSMPDPAPDEFHPFAAFSQMMEAFNSGLGVMISQATATIAQAPETPDANASSKPVPPPAQAARDVSPPLAPEALPAGQTSKVGEMMDSTRKFQEDYVREMAVLFERYQGDMKVA